MNPQSITITGRSFWKFRALMDASLNRAVEKMLAAGVDKGTVCGQIEVKLDRSVDEKTGEVTIRPRFVFNTTYSVQIKNSEKDETNEELVLFKDKNGVIRICENQVTMDDILENSEIVDPEDELAGKLNAQEGAEDGQEDGEQAEDDQEDADGDPDDEE